MVYFTVIKGAYKEQISSLNSKQKRERRHLLVHIYDGWLTSQIKCNLVTKSETTVDLSVYKCKGGKTDDWMNQLLDGGNSRRKSPSKCPATVSVYTMLHTAALSKSRLMLKGRGKHNRTYLLAALIVRAGSVVLF